MVRRINSRLLDIQQLYDLRAGLCSWLMDVVFVVAFLTKLLEWFDGLVLCLLWRRHEDSQPIDEVEG